MKSNKNNMNQTIQSIKKAVDILHEVLDQGHEVYSQRELEKIIDDLDDIFDKLAGAQ